MGSPQRSVQPQRQQYHYTNNFSPPKTPTRPRRALQDLSLSAAANKNLNINITTTNNNNNDNTTTNSSHSSRSSTSSTSNVNRVNNANFSAASVASSTASSSVRIVDYSPPVLSSSTATPSPSPSASSSDLNRDDYYPPYHNNSHDDRRNVYYNYGTPPLSTVGATSIYTRTPLPTSSAHILAPAPSLPLAQGRALGGYPRHSAVSAFAFPPNGQALAPATTSYLHHNPQSSQPSSPASHNGGDTTPKARPLRKKRSKHVALNPDNKTFRVLDLDQQPASQIPPEARSLLSSPPSLASPTASSLSHDRLSSDTGGDIGIDASARSASLGSPPSTAASSSTSIDGPIKSPLLAEDHITSSPWNYTLVGGLRKVPKTPDLKQRATTATTSYTPLPALQESSDDSNAVPELSTKASFQSSATIDSIISSDGSNYNVHESSPCPAPQAVAASSSQHSPSSSIERPPRSQFDSHDHLTDSHLEATGTPNFRILDLSPPHSTSQSSERQLDESPSLIPLDSDYNLNNYNTFEYSSSFAASELDLSSVNYQIHGEESPSSSQVALSGPLGLQTYSRESLVVPPLRPNSKRSTENFGYYKQRSRESLRAGSLTRESFRTGSFTSITSTISQEALRFVLTSGSALNFPGSSSSASSSWVNSLALPPARAPMQAHPHQWSSQLSTVPSESDGGTDRGSRTFSDVSRLSDVGGWRNNGLQSSHTRRIPSISSSLQHREEANWEELDYPQPVFARNGFRDATGSTIRVVEDQDEYGDGLTDMPNLRSIASRNRLSNFYSLGSDDGRTNTMRSTSSSRANSLLASSLPAWARLYYGSGERRYLGVNTSASEISSVSRLSSMRSDSGSPSSANFPQNLYSPRRRPRQINPSNRRPGTRDSMGINPLPHVDHDGALVHGNYRSRFRSSSIWSPHLGIDRRANAKRLTVWDGAPSINFSTESGMFGRRNRQLVLFVVGFIFPISWMIASFLPLPQQPLFVMRERDRHGSTANLDMIEDMAREFRPMNEARYESARWWRTLNRAMAIVGVAVIAAIVTLSVLGVTQNWTVR